MKKKRAWLILTCVLVVLLIAYFALQAWNRQAEEKEADTQTVSVTDTDAENITEIVYDVGNGEMSFKKEDGTWYYTPDRDFPLKQSTLENIAEAMGNLEADRELTDGDSLADYGLEEPAYTVTLTDSKENVTEIYFGDLTGDDYYVTTGNKEKIYTVASTAIGDLQQSLDDMAQFDDYPSIGSGNLKKEVITQNGETTTYDSENEEQSEDIAAVAGGLGAVSLTEAADYSVEEADLAGFGLDEKTRITVEATYTQDDEENVLTLYIGNEDGNGKRYVMMNDSRIVYLISTEVCDNILNRE